MLTRKSRSCDFIRVCSGFALGAVSITLLPSAAGAQQHVAWSTVDAGGATSATGGSFRLRATVGQIDAGPPQSSSGLTLNGGFWPGMLALSQAIFSDGFVSGGTSGWSAAVGNLALHPLAAADEGQARRFGNRSVLELPGVPSDRDLETRSDSGPVPQEIPTLDNGGLTLLAILLMACALAVLRRRGTFRKPSQR